MRVLALLSLFLLLCTRVSAQTAPDSNLVFTAVAIDTLELLTAPAWKEIKPSAKAGYLLSFAGEGNFDEDAGSDGARKYRHLLGRWKREGKSITLSVDAFMGEGLLDNRYRRGRDYFVEYEIIELSAQELILKDRKTGKRRIFVATDKSQVEDQSEARKPQAPKTTKWTLPDFGDF